MSVVSTIRELLARGFTVEQALTAAQVFEVASATSASPPAEPSESKTARSLRNARYYQNRKERLKASESKTSEKVKTSSDAPKPLSDASCLNSDADPDALARVEDNLLTPTLLDKDSMGLASTPRPRAQSTSRSRTQSVREILLECLPPETVDALIDHRKAVERELTPNTARHLLAQFQATNDPAAAASMMVSRGWRGFQPDWYEREKSNGTDRSVHDSARRLQERVHAGKVSFGKPPASLHVLRSGRG